MLVGLGAAVVLFFLFLRSRPIELEQHAEVTNDLQKLAALELEWNRSLLRSRADMRQPEDELAQRLSDLDSELDKLERAARDLEDGSGELALLFQRYTELLRAERELMARYAADSGAFKRGLEQLPDAVAAFSRAAPHLARDKTIAGALDEVLSRLVLHALVADPALGPEAQAALTVLRSAETRRDIEEREALARLVVEIEALLAHKADVETVLADFERMPLARRNQELARACNLAFENRLRRADLYRLALYLFCLLLLAKLLQSMHQLKKSARDLNRANSTLEERVHDRTQLLSRINTELESEVYERKKAEIEAQRAREAAEAANRTKSEFLANMSHEIRTPMTAILGFSERLVDTELAEAERVDAVASIRRNGDYLMQIINDILDLSKIEAGKLAIERIECSPAQLVSEVRNAVELRATSKGLAFEVVLPARLPEAILADPVRVKQVLLNLVGNAIKFTERGRVTFLVEYRASSDAVDGANARPRSQVPQLVFTVRDTGIGMRPDEIRRLFRPFTQADTSTTRRFGGTGLGLSISKHLAEMMAGSIDVESEPGRGSTFTFTMAALGVEATRLVEVAVLAAAGPSAVSVLEVETPVLACRILIAEDGEDNRRLLAHVLRRAGSEFVIAENGERACEIALENERAGRGFDVILMDMQMPVLDGYGATRRLRAHGLRTPIIALTANAMATDRARCLEAGCDEFCTKPFDRSGLLETIARFTRERAVERDSATARAVTAPPPPGVPAAASAARIVVEDDPEMLELIGLFVADLAGDVEAMTAALERGDLDELATRAHQLKGCAGSYGFPALTEPAGRVEAVARAGAPAPEIRSELEILSRVARTVGAGRVES